MANTDNEEPQPIIVKKVKKGGHGHHGGAWKVAYADFVTAMMAFFLLMWLLNVTTEEQKNAISNYFDPTHPRVSSDLSGSGGILGGLSMAPDGAQVSNVQHVSPPATPTTPRSGAAMGDQRDHLGTSDYEGDSFDVENEGNRPSDTDKTSNSDEGGEFPKDGNENILDTLKDIQKADVEQLEAIVREFENQDFEDVKKQILQEVEKSPELADLMDNLMVDITPEGLRIQIVDNEGRSMFPSGSAKMHGFMKKLVEKVTQVVVPQTNEISVRGHTDGKPYPKGAKYNNWNLSSDRALASQRAMLDGGLGADRVQNVVGKADREHLLPDEPLSPRNRRISIILLRDELENADEIRQKAADAIKNAAEKKAKKQQENPTIEDREDAPELDRVINGSTSFSLEDGGSDQATQEDDSGVIGGEIEKIRARQEAQSLPPARPLPGGSDTPFTNDEPQILEFP